MYTAWKMYNTDFINAQQAKLAYRCPLYLPFGGMNVCLLVCPRNKQRQNGGHIRKILHIQRDTIQQPNQ
jgi:hypothetical protein